MRTTLREDVRGSEVHLEPVAVADRLELVERDIQPVRHGIRTVLDENVAPADLAPLDSGQAHRHALARLRPLDVAVVDLHAPRANRPARRLETEHVAVADRARPERPGDDGADSPQRERPVDPEPGRSVRVRALGRIGCPPERRAQLVEPGSGLCADSDRLGLGHELASLLECELERLRVHRVGLRDRDDPVSDSKQPQDREVLTRLRARPLAPVDHEQEEVDARRAGHHRPHEPLVSRNVDDRDATPIRELERRIAEVDRDPAPALLGQPVRVLPGQRPNEPRLAVVDVTSRADRQRHQRRLTSNRHGLCSQRPWISSSGTKPRAR